MSEPEAFVVSVLVATHNQAAYLSQCLESIEGQAWPRSRLDVVVVDDGSTDGSPAVLDAYRSRVRQVVHPRRRGLAAACNTALQHATGTFVLRVDSDDWLDPHALTRLSEAVTANPRVDIVVPAYHIVEGDRLEIARPELTNLFTWMAGGVLLRRGPVLEVGGYREFFWEEYDLYVRLLLRGAQAASIPSPILYHREHRESMTASQARRNRGWDELKAAWGFSTLQRFGFTERLGAPWVEPREAGGRSVR